MTRSKTLPKKKGDLFSSKIFGNSSMRQPFLTIQRLHFGTSCECKHERIHVQTHSLTLLLLFLKIFKLCIGILLGSQSRLHTRQHLHLCLSRLAFDSSVDIACFLMKFHSSMFAHKAISYKVRGPTRSGNARNFKVWLYRERCVHILYAF